MPPEALIQALAEREVQCHCWHVIDRNEGRTGTIREAPTSDCDVCKGTGYIPEFPGLRRECPFDNCVGIPGAVMASRNPADGYDKCLDCQGRGWLPVSLDTAAGVLMDMLAKDKWQITIWANGDVTIWNSTKQISGKGPNRHVAVLKACARSKGVEVKEDASS